jgi:trimethylamine corrinoid protein
MFETLITEYNEAVIDTDRERALEVVEQALDQGVTPRQIIFDLVVPAMANMVKSSLEEFDASLAQQWMTAQIANEVTDAMIAKMATAPTTVGKIIIGTAEGDMHSLGKRIIIGCLKAQMIEAVDLGVNVSAEKFVDEAVAHEASVIAISAMMTHTATSEQGPLGVRRLLRERGLEDQIKIIVGGAPFRFDPELYKTVEADATAEEGIAAGDTIVQLINEVKA